MLTEQISTINNHLNLLGVSSLTEQEVMYLDNTFIFIPFDVCKQYQCVNSILTKRSEDNRCYYYDRQLFTNLISKEQCATITPPEIKTQGVFLGAVQL